MHGILSDSEESGEEGSEGEEEDEGGEENDWEDGEENEGDCGEESVEADHDGYEVGRRASHSTSDVSLDVSLVIHKSHIVYLGLLVCFFQSQV